MSLCVACQTRFWFHDMIPSSSPSLTLSFFLPRLRPCFGSVWCFQGERERECECECERECECEYECECERKPSSSASQHVDGQAQLSVFMHTALLPAIAQVC